MPDGGFVVEIDVAAELTMNDVEGRLVDDLARETGLSPLPGALAGRSRDRVKLERTPGLQSPGRDGAGHSCSAGQGGGLGTLTGLGHEEALPTRAPLGRSPLLALPAPDPVAACSPANLLRLQAAFEQGL